MIAGVLCMCYGVKGSSCISRCYGSVFCLLTLSVFPLVLEQLIPELNMLLELLHQEYLSTSARDKTNEVSSILKKLRPPDIQ